MWKHLLEIAKRPKYLSQDDRVQYSAVVPHAMEMQPEKDPRTTDTHPEMTINIAYGPIEPPVSDKFEMGENVAYGSRKCCTLKLMD